MTNDKLLAEGEAYADLVGYQGRDKEIASVAYMRGIEKTIEKACESFCKAHCPLQYDMCQQREWKKDCLAYFNFEREMKGK